MAKISEVAKAECVRRQNKYKDLLSVVESKLNKLLIATSCYVAIDSIDVRSENQLNDGRRYINKAIILLEEALGNHSDDSLSLNDNIHEYLKDKLNDEWRYKFICSFGYVIDFFKYCYGETSKWLQNFYEIEWRFALISKNIIDFKNYIKELSPDVEGYIYRVKLMRLCKSLLSAAAEQHRTKYELTLEKENGRRHQKNVLISFLYYFTLLL